MRQKKALDGSHLEVFLAPQHRTEHDFDLSISNLFLTFVQLLQEIKKKQERGYAFKFKIYLKAFLEKFSFENNKVIKIDVWFPSNTYTLLDSVNIRKKINIAIRDIYKRYDSFVQRGSGWVLKKVSKFSVSIMKFKLFKEAVFLLYYQENYVRNAVVSLWRIFLKTSVSFTVLLLPCVKILRISIGRISNMIKLLNYYHLTIWKVQYQYEK